MSDNHNLILKEIKNIENALKKIKHTDKTTVIVKSLKEANKTINDMINDLSKIKAKLETIKKKKSPKETGTTRKTKETGTTEKTGKTEETRTTKTTGKTKETRTTRTTGTTGMTELLKAIGPKLTKRRKQIHPDDEESDNDIDENWDWGGRLERLLGGMDGMDGLGRLDELDILYELDG